MKSGLANPSITLASYAKVNLGLEVLRRAADGHHQIKTILQTIDLEDKITFSLDSDLVLDESGFANFGEENLVLQTARLLQKTANCKQGARIQLKKNIPVSSGLGGGSSNAATTLMGLNRLWGLMLNQEKLHKLALTLGCDVPFFLYGGTALAEGRGESITPIPSIQSRHLLLVCPENTIPSKTKTLYSSLQQQHFSSGQRIASLATKLALGEQDIGSIYNTFNNLALEIFPGQREAIDAFKQSGAKNITLSGTGPSIFAITNNDNRTAIMDKMRRKGFRAYLATTL